MGQPEFVAELHVVGLIHVLLAGNEHLEPRCLPLKTCASTSRDVVSH